MTKTKRVTGNGITQREQTRYSGGDVDEGIRQVFGGLSGRDSIAAIKQHMRRVLETAGITTDMKAHRLGDVKSDLLREHETPEWYAVAVLTQLDMMDCGDQRAAACCALEAGMLYREGAIKLLWENHALRGEKIFKGGSKGGREKAKVHGWKHRAAELQAAINRKQWERPGLSYERVCDLVAKDKGCGKSTVKTYTTNRK